MSVYHQTKDRLKNYILTVAKGRETLWQSSVAAASIPGEYQQQSCPYLPAVLGTLAGVTKKILERRAGHSPQISRAIALYKNYFLPSAWGAMGVCCRTSSARQKQMPARVQIKMLCALADSKSLSRCSFSRWQHAKKFHVWLVSVWFSLTGTCWESHLISCFDLFSISLRDLGVWFPVVASGSSDSLRSVLLSCLIPVGC